MNGKCSLGAMNGNIQFIGLVMLTCIVIIVAIYYFRDVNNKHSKILEKYEEAALADLKKSQNINTNYGANHDGGRNSQDLLELSNRPIVSRPCQIYFANESVCDNDSRKNGTCKYVFEDGWKEIASINGSSTADDPTSTNTYNKKIYNQNYSINSDVNNPDIPNFKVMGGCFKKVSANNAIEDNRFLYKSNNLVKYGYGGKGEKVSLNVDGQQGNYITMYFNNDTVPKNNYEGALDSICSIAKDSIASLRNITTNSVNPFFYKFGINSNNKVNMIRISKWENVGTKRPSRGREIVNAELSRTLTNKTKITIDELISFQLAAPPNEYDYVLSKGNYYVIGVANVLDITLVELNLEQNTFINRGIADFVQSSAVGIEYKNTTVGKINFNVFKQSTLPDMNVQIYQFKYNYLCDVNIAEYVNQINTKISLNSFIVSSDTAEDGKQPWSITSYQEINSEFWNSYTQRSPRQDQKLKIVADLRAAMATKVQAIETGSEASRAIITLNATKARWLALKTPADAAKDSFHTKTFTELMTLRKEPFTDVNGTSSSNSTIKPFDYQLGYYMHAESPEGPFNPSEKYGDKSLNQTSFSYRLIKAFSPGKPGLKGRKRSGGYYRGRINEINAGAAAATREGIEDFSALWTMGNGNGENYFSWYWTGFFCAHEAGYYYFHTYSDDDSYVYLDGREVVNNGGAHPDVWRQGGPVYFQKGEWKKLEITFSEQGGGETMQFGWWRSGQASSWIRNARYNGKIYIYDAKNLATDRDTVNTVPWKFNEDGSYYAEINSLDEEFVLESMKLNGNSFTLNTKTKSPPDKWDLMIFKQGVDEPYDFYIQGRSNTKKVYLKAVDKVASLKRKTSYVLTPTGTDKFYIDTFANQNTIDEWWNDSIGDNGVIKIMPYQLKRFTIVAFVYLQKGSYKFSAVLDLPKALEIQRSILIIGGITEGADKYFNVTSGRFYMFSYSCYVLNSSPNTITPVFALSADFKSSDNSFTKLGVDMSPYIYGGVNLYADYNLQWFKDMFTNIKVFQPNNATDFNNIKEFLTPTTGRGRDFWNLTLINGKIADLTTQLASKTSILATAKKGIEDTYNATINSIEGLDYDAEFMKNTKYFNNPEIIYKTDVDISSIFSNMAGQDVGITSYITYEKIKDPAGRTSTDRATNFNIVNSANKSIYLLKSSINLA